MWRTRPARALGPQPRDDADRNVRILREHAEQTEQLSLAGIEQIEVEANGGGHGFVPPLILFGFGIVESGHPPRSEALLCLRDRRAEGLAELHHPVA